MRAGKSDGIVIVAVLIALAVMVVMITYSASAALRNYQTNGAERSGLQALYVADSGIQFAEAVGRYHYLSHPVADRPSVKAEEIVALIHGATNDVEMDDAIGTYKIFAASTGGTVTVTSTGTYRGSTKVITTKYSLPLSIAVPATVVCSCPLTLSGNASIDGVRHTDPYEKIATVTIPPPNNSNNTTGDVELSNISGITVGDYIRIAGNLHYRVAAIPTTAPNTITVEQVAGDLAVLPKKITINTDVEIIRPAAAVDVPAEIGGVINDTKELVIRAAGPFGSPSSDDPVVGDTIEVAGPTTTTEARSSATVKLREDLGNGRVRLTLDSNIWASEGAGVYKVTPGVLSDSSIDISGSTVLTGGAAASSPLPQADELFKMVFGDSKLNVLGPDYLTENTQDLVGPQAGGQPIYWKKVTPGNNVSLSVSSSLDAPVVLVIDLRTDDTQLTFTGPEKVSLQVGDFAGLLYVIGNADIRGNSTFLGSVVIEGTDGVVDIRGGSGGTQAPKFAYDAGKLAGTAAGDFTQALGSWTQVSK